MKRVRLTLEMIKFEHSVFALPFALTGALLAWRDAGFVRQGLWIKLLWIVVCMVAARSTAMAFNRVLDADIDGRNPRTRMRHLPAGSLSRGFAWGFIAVWSVVFLFAARELNPLCFKLAPLALAILMFYSYTKRFTSLSHAVLGLSLGIAPAGAWIAVRGDFSAAPALLMVAVATWIGGFDVLYAISDADFDRAAGLHSIPARFGIKSSLLISALLHLMTVAALIALAAVAGLGVPFLIGVGIVLTLLIWEHAIVTPTDLSRLNVAFFSLNGYVSVAFLAATLLDLWLR